MATAIITRIYLVNLDSPLYPDDMPAQQRLTEWLEEARKDPEIAFKCLVQDDVDGKLYELMMKTSPDEMEKAFDHVVAIVIVLAIALIVIFSAVAGGLAGYDMGRRERESNNYRDKVNFCHDRMKNDAVQAEWRQMYCVKSEGRK
jgi:hypothetical protein